MKKSRLIQIALVVLAVVAICIATLHTTGTSTSIDTDADHDTPSILTETYSNSTYGFSLQYPPDLKPSSFKAPDGVSDIVLLAGNSTSTGMQILISAFDEPLTALTADRIKQDQPDMTILEPQDVIIGSSGKGVSFLDGSGASANRQVWFIEGGHLYQVTAPAGFDVSLTSILNTWTFK